MTTVFEVAKELFIKNAVIGQYPDKKLVVHCYQQALLFVTTMKELEKGEK